ncbi:RNA recognition motif domain-containing protein [Ditylenchus destructor]|nr:RNA recognition motif domain-containing protein [Ditylenchus destructor]
MMQPGMMGLTGDMDYGGGGGTPTQMQMGEQNPITLCNPETTLWMGDLKMDWDVDFIKSAFQNFGHDAQNVKMVTDRSGTRPASYCFVEFVDAEGARNAMLALAGRSIPNDPDRNKFNLSFANSPNQFPEHNLFASNLDSRVDDVALFRVFGEKYPSCRGAKVYRNYDGSSREFGFVRFTDEMDQQRALIEMNKHRLKGREIVLKLAQPKERGRGGGRGYSSRGGSYGGSSGFGSRPRYSNFGQQSSFAPAIPNPQIYGANHGMAGFGAPVQSYNPIGAQAPYGSSQYSGGSMAPKQDYHYRGSRSGSRDYDSYRSHRSSYQSNRHQQPLAPASVAPAVPPPVYFEGEEPLTADEHNELLMGMSADFFTMLESSRWSRVAVPIDARAKELTTLFYSNGL